MKTKAHFPLIVALICSLKLVKSADKPFTAQVVENIVKNEIERKMPAAVNHKKSMTGKDELLNGEKAKFLTLSKIMMISRQHLFTEMLTAYPVLE